MTFTDETIDARTRVFAVTGELVGTSGAQLIASAREALDGETQHIVIDLTEMTFMDSGGLAALLGTWSACAVAGGRCIVVLAPASPALRSLEIRGVQGVFELASTRAEALARLREE